MKAGFIAANPTMIRVDWSFVPEESKETIAEEAPEEGEVSGAARASEDIMVLDEQMPAPAKQLTNDQAPPGDLALPDQLD